MENLSREIIDRVWNNPDSRLLEAIKGQKWTSHNIPLTPSTSTMGDTRPLIGNDQRCRLIKETIATFTHERPGGSTMRVVDLGCLEGGLAFEMAREGMNVLGVEGRRSNFEKCALIEQYYRLPNLRFIHLDVTKLSRAEQGEFDVVLCCGLLYHLENPASFLETLNAMTHRTSMLFLDTHVAPPEKDLEECVFRNELSPPAVLDHGGVSYGGRWFSEPSPDDVNVEGNEWASVSNERSFWPDHDSLVKMLYRAGFTRIFELYGGYGIDEEFELRKKYSRLHCVGLKK